MKNYAFRCSRNHKAAWQSGVRAARQGKWLKDSSGQRLVTVTDGGENSLPILMYIRKSHDSKSAIITLQKSLDYVTIK